MAGDADYEAAIRRGLDEAFARAAEEPLDPAARIVVLSDHHRGAGDQADDFRRCEHAYATALGWYLEQGYRLFLLGDTEELWEEPPQRPLRRYRDVLALEGEFLARGALERFWGNHDDLWADERQVRKHLQPALGGAGGRVTVREGLRVRVRRPGREDVTLFFVHGHQGTADSDRFGWASRLFVRHVWRPIQRKTGYSATTPATDHALRAKHGRAMFAWACSRPGTVLIAGHTHQPVFAGSQPDPPPTRPIPELQAGIEAARAAGDTARAAALRAELEHARTAERRPDTATVVQPPCYFNTGCCSFPDGDATGLEIADGEIRLVRWAANLRETPRTAAGELDLSARILASERLDAVLDAVSGPPSEASRIEERSVTPSATGRS
jgi:hypothetical protein